jgi:acetolactate synthase-1/2/3 large subunit
MQQGFQLHDVDQQALMRPLTKATYKIESYDEVMPTVYRAYLKAIEGEPGPVYIELPANLQLLSGEVADVPPFKADASRPELDANQIKAAVALLSSAERPGIFVGWGAREVVEDIRRIAEHIGAPVATTLQGLAAFPADHPLHTGMGFGPAAVPAAQNAFKDCDAMLAVGTRFAEICTGSFGAVPPSNLVHIDINPGALGRNHPARVPINADSRDAVPALAEAMLNSGPARDRAALEASIAADKAAWLEQWLAHDSGGRVNPGKFFSSLRSQLDRDAVVVADDGNQTFLTAELMPIYGGGNYLSPTDFNCMGYCVPGCIGAKLAQPDRQVIGIVGDGAFLMTGLETVTAVKNELGVAWFVFNDGELSQIAQAQEMPYQRKTCTTVGALDYSMLAAATGCEFVAIDNDDMIEAGIDRAIGFIARNRPVIVDVRIDYTKKTQFTIGAVKTNLKRFDTRNKLRIVSRALWRKMKNRK